MFSVRFRRKNQKREEEPRKTRNGGWLPFFGYFSVFISSFHSQLAGVTPPLHHFSCISCLSWFLSSLLLSVSSTLDAGMDGSALIDGAHTIDRWLTDRAATVPAHTAIDDRGVRIGYADLETRSRELAAGLRRAGYGPGDRIATVSGNSIDHVVAFFACAKSGVAFVPLSWRLAPRELAEVLTGSAPALVLVEDEYEGLAADALRRVAERCPVAPLGTTGVEAAVPARLGPAVPLRGVRDDDPLLVIYTSGSESAPKGVVLTHANCFWNNLALAGAQQLTGDDVVLAMLPQDRKSTRLNSSHEVPSRMPSSA